MHLAVAPDVAEAVRVRRIESPPQRALSAWIRLAALACFAALALPFFLGRVYVADDLGEFHLPLRNFYAEQLSRGEPFDWMPGLFGGFYVTAEGQLGAYHPLHLLLYRWLPLGAAFDLELLASYPLLFGGMYFWLKRWLERRDAALAGALFFTFSGFNLLHFVHPNAVAIVAHIPWLLLAIEVSLTAPRGPRRATAELAIGVLTASQLLLGYPQYVWFSLLVETAYAAWRAVTLHATLARVGTLVSAKALGALTAAVQLLPTIDGLLHSTRGAADSGFANTGALHPLNLVQLAAPYLFQTRVVGQNTHELGLYAGAVPLVLCVWLLAQRERWGRFAPLVWATLIFAGVAFLLALGQAGGLYWLQSLVPAINRFRFPCRAIVLVQLCTAVIAATAFAQLRQSALDGQRATRRADRALVVTFFVSVALAVVGPIVWGEYVASPLLIASGPLLVGAAALLVALAERNVRGAWVALVFFAAADLSIYGLSYSVYPHTADLHEFASQISIPHGESHARVAAKETGGLRTGNRPLLAGVERVDGYAGLEPAKRLDYSKLPALRLAGAQFLLRPVTNEAATQFEWTPIEPTAPRVRLLTRTVAAGHLGKLDSLGFDVVALDEPLELPTADSGTAQAINDRPGQLAIACQAPTRQLLVTTESFHPGWQAVVDGTDQPIVRVDGDFLGCAVEAGTHEVAFRFRPTSLLMGECLSAGGLVLMVSLFWLHCGSRPRNVIR